MSFIIQEQAGGLYASDIEQSVYPVALPASVAASPNFLANTSNGKNISLTTTTEIMLFTTSNGVMAVVFDSVANAFGAVVLVRASVLNAEIGAVKISSTQVLVSTLVINTTALETVVLSVSGTTITVNTPLATTLGASSAFLTKADTLIQVGSSYVLGYARNVLIYYLGFTVSGTTVTAGSETSSGLPSTGGQGILIPFNASVFVVGTSAVGGTSMAFLPVSVSGTTFTNGTAATDAMLPTSTVLYGISANGNIMVTGRGTLAGTIRGLILTISGTVASASAVDLVVGSTANAVSLSIVIGNQMMITVQNSGIVLGLTDVAGVATAAINYPTLGNPSLVGYDKSGVVFIRSDSYGLFYAQFSGNDVVATPEYFIKFNSTAQFIAMSTFNAPFSNWDTQATLLRTPSGKQCSPNTLSALLYSYELNEVPVVQQTAGLGGGNFRRSALSEAQGWFLIRSGLDALFQKVVLT